MSVESNGFWIELRWSDVIAVIGALAWLPHLIKLFRKPVVTTIVGHQVEIGFTGLGPIFNPTLAYRVQNRDAFITEIECEVTHERGQRTVFRALQLAETPAVTVSTTGDAGYVQTRTQASVAVALVPGNVAERKPSATEKQRKATMDPLIVAYQRAIRRLEDADPVRWYEAVARAAEHHALREFFRDSFIWQAGEYSAVIRSTVEGLDAPASVSFNFTLTEAHVRLLRDNFTGLDWELRRMWSEYSLEAPGQYRWQWVYPDVRATAALRPAPTPARTGGR